jgi:lauroyl/myristoyl acyltransferase
MDLQRILHSKKAGLWALRISRLLPPGLGFRLADYLGDRISSSPDLPVVKAIRQNRWVVSGGEIDPQKLEESVQMTFRNLARSFYLLFHLAGKPKEIQKVVLFGERMEQLIAASKARSGGVMIAGLHMSYFDLALHAVAYRGMDVLTVSLPEETEHREAIEWQHELRRSSGLEILPASFKSFRTAIRRLQEGGAVLTGIDRPIDSPKHQPLFYNRLANLPVHHILLALEAKVPVVLLAAIRNSKGLYQIHVTPDIKMREFGDRDRSLLYNAGQVLEAAQQLINLAPEQWSVLLPVWPELDDQIP